MPLYHFSDQDDIAVFRPRPVATPVARPSGQSWLNGSLVWAIEDTFALLYLFPRDCPRLLIWPTPRTHPADRAHWFNTPHWKAIAFIEAAWVLRLKTACLYRYDLPETMFRPVGTLGMWVSSAPVRPKRCDTLTDLPECLTARSVDLRIVETLTCLRPLYNTTLHVSGLRLRNVPGWGPPGWPHSGEDTPPEAGKT